MSTDTPRDRIELLQLLRGIAALMVVMFHARIYQAPSPDNAFSAWFTASGASGVDLFFCISGFVMVYTTRTPASQRVSDFVIKRLCRVVPVYIFTTLIFVAVMRLVEHKTGFYDPDYRFGAGEIVKSLLFIPQNLTSGSEAPMWGGASLHVGWTLNYEMYFYAVFACSLLFGRLRWIVFSGWLALTLVALPLVFKHSMTLDAYRFYDWHLPYLNFMTSPMVWEFAGGVALGHVYLRGWRFANRATAWLATMLASVYVVWLLLNQVNPGFGPDRWGYAYAMLLAVLLFADNTLHFRIPRALVWLGNISFSLYLVHPIVVEGLGVTLLQFQRLRPHLTATPYVLLLTAISVCAAYPVHIWIEKRLSDALRRKLIGGKGRSAASEVVAEQPLGG